MKQTILILLMTLGMRAQVQDSLIAYSERLTDTSLTVNVRCDNYEYIYLIENKRHSTTFTMLEQKKLYTDWRKIGGMSYFFGAWALMFADIKEDKVKHFIAGHGVAMATYCVTKKNRVAKSIIVASLVGIGKEMLDKYAGMGSPTVMDAVWTGVGGVYGSFTIPMFKTKPVKPIINGHIR